MLHTLGLILDFQDISIKVNYCVTMMKNPKDETHLGITIKTSLYIARTLQSKILDENHKKANLFHDVKESDHLFTKEQKNFHTYFKSLSIFNMSKSIQYGKQDYSERV